MQQIFMKNCPFLIFCQAKIEEAILQAGFFLKNQIQNSAHIAALKSAVAFKV